MSSSCSCHNLNSTQVTDSYRRILIVIIAINITLFFIEFAASYWSNSRALQADSLDFLADSMTYSLSLAVLTASGVWRSWAALIKGFSLLGVGLWVMGTTIHTILNQQVPSAGIMGSIALLAFLANMTSALLLMKHRDGDANIRSVWLCSRNDAIGNLSVFVGAFFVSVFSSPWPDIIIALGLASLFLHSAYEVIRSALVELKLSKLKLKG